MKIRSKSAFVFSFSLLFYCAFVVRFCPRHISMAYSLFVLNVPLNTDQPISRKFRKWNDRCILYNVAVGSNCHPEKKKRKKRKTRFLPDAAHWQTFFPIQLFCPKISSKSCHSFPNFQLTNTHTRTQTNSTQHRSHYLRCQRQRHAAWREGLSLRQSSCFNSHSCAQINSPSLTANPISRFTSLRCSLRSDVEVWTLNSDFTRLYFQQRN